MTAKKSQIRFSRRDALVACAITPVARVHFASGKQSSIYSIPIGWPNRIPGDGFWIRHGYACENTWYNPGWWHTGEDWYALDDEETAGAEIYAVADGEVVFVGSEYPGRVVIVEHPGGLYSMYGHLDHDVLVGEGQPVSRGQQLGAVFLRTDGIAPSHLHFEIRDFLFNDRVNGRFPEHGVTCGLQCPPGPGYWPMSASEHPSQLGWRNPAHVVAANSLIPGTSGDLVIVAATGASSAVQVQSSPMLANDAAPIAVLPLETETTFSVLDVWAGDQRGDGTSADAYTVWFLIEISEGVTGWVSALRPTNEETGSDGRPSALRFDFLIVD